MSLVAMVFLLFWVFVGSGILAEMFATVSDRYFFWVFARHSCRSVATS
jgi:hypothetical protein